MKLSAIKKLIKEEFLREIKIDKRKITINPSIINDKDPTVQGELEVLKGIYDVIVAKINDKDPIVQGELKALKGIFDIADMIAAKAKQQGLDYSFQASIEYEKDVSWMEGYTDGSHGRIVMVFSKGSAKLGIMAFDNSRWGDSGYSITLKADTKKGEDVLRYNGCGGYMKSDRALEGIFAWIVNV